MGKVNRKIVTIDEERCDGCGLCVPSCAEGAIQIIDGKARLVSEIYCDGLGACLGECPQDAITLEERPAEAFDAAAVEEHLHSLESEGATPPPEAERKPAGHAGHGHGFSCPGARTMDLRAAEEECVEPEATFEGELRSELRQWPVKLYLVSPTAPYFNNAELLIAADCAPLAYAAFHPDFLKNKAVVIGCPKFDDLDLYREKLTAILQANDVKKVTVLHMEVPCCFGIAQVAREAVRASGKNIPYEDVTVTIRGEAVVGAGV
ncbi:MAG: 4Fe-4S binding protein [Candidatus Coatesbacteria bacterium]|nr:MAG: 4Fe-4S binding protein [Candidatus Coatesbacteria bacterium]